MTGATLGDADHLRGLDADLARAPARQSTPGPTRRSVRMPPRHTRAGPAPTASSAAAQASPTHQAARRTSASQSGSPAGMIRSIQTTAAGIDEHGASTAARGGPPSTPAAAGRAGIDIGLRLAAAEDQGRPIDLQDPGQPDRAARSASGPAEPSWSWPAGPRRRSMCQRPAGQRSSGQAGGSRPQVRLPVGADGAGGDQDPGPLPRGRRPAPEPHAAVLEQPVPLAGVARPARGHHVVPACSPPLLRGITWSMFSADAPQYWQR